MSSSPSATHQANPPAPALTSPPPASPSDSPATQPHDSLASTDFLPLRSQSPEHTNDEDGGIAELPKSKSSRIPESSSLRGGRKITPPSRRGSHVVFEGATAAEEDGIKPI